MKKLKSILDIILALLLLILLSPVMIIITFLIWIKIGFPAVFKQERVGLHEDIFVIYKFRSMTNEKNFNNELLADSQRLSRFGKLLRSLSLDELPQLFNVIKAEMSFVGPRPLLAEYLPLYSLEQKKRHNVKPGITGWAQINGRNSISWEKKFNLDIWYVQNWSLLLDFKILFLTFLNLSSRKDVKHEGYSTMPKFNGHN